MKKQKIKLGTYHRLILGTLTVFFPLYMACYHCLSRKPSEMTNDVAGALSFPSKWSFSKLSQRL